MPTGCDPCQKQNYRHSQSFSEGVGDSADFIARHCSFPVIRAHKGSLIYYINGSCPLSLYSRWFQRPLFCSALFLRPLRLVHLERSTVAPSISSPAPFTYQINQFRCYKYVPQATSFLMAEKSCESMGGNLVSVTNAYENSYISGIASSINPSGSYWIGVSLLLSARWSWTDGTNTTYLPWGVGEPSDTSPYQCGAIRLADNMWMWETILPNLIEESVQKGALQLYEALHVPD